MLSVALIIVPTEIEASAVNGLLDKNPTINYNLVVTDNGQKAQSFIDNMGQQAISFLSNKSLSQSQKEREFRKLLKSSFDMKTIARFAMGRHWKTASAKQQAEYLQLFEKMVVSAYTERFNEYRGENIDVTSSRADGSRDIIVSSNIVPSAGSKIKVDWRVRKNKSGTYKIIDVIIEGVSMSLTQRSDFSSVIQRGGGDVEVLLRHLRK